MKNRLLKRGGQVIMIVAFTVALLEVSYRFQWIEFYNVELQHLNSAKQLKSDQETVLIFGDSFSAQSDNYVDHLRDALPHFNFVNAAIPGTSIRQHQLFLQKRIKKFQPTKIIYQAYVGNDLTDVSHPINFQQLSLARNVYWWLSDHLLIIPYLNYRLSILKSKPTSRVIANDSSFDVARYNPRTKLYLSANPSVYNEAILTTGKLKEVYEEWLEMIEVFLKEIPKEIEVMIVVVPHCTQVNAEYKKRYEQLGASFSLYPVNDTFPFFTRLKEKFSGYKVLNPVPALSQAQDVYLMHDPHFSKKGHEVLSRVVLNEFFE